MISTWGDVAKAMRGRIALITTHRSLITNPSMVALAEDVELGAALESPEVSE